MASLRSKGEIFLATASSGIAATLLPGGRTAHSRFKIPIDIQSSSICAIQKQKKIANLIRIVAAIIWDEAPMTNKNCLEALDRSLQDICSNNAPFGGKVLIMGGDFRQVLPVVRKSTKAQIISACIVQSHLWNHTKISRLCQNIRSLHDQEFPEFLIRIGDGVEPTKPDDTIRLPLHIAIPWKGEHSIQVLIQHIFLNMELHGWDAPYMVQRAILTLTNDDVQKLKDMIIDQFPGEEHNLLSFDEVEGDNHNLYQQEFLNSIAQACIVQSYLWNHTKILRLCQDMQTLHDQEFPEFLIRIGDGVEPTKRDDTVMLPLHIAIPWKGEHSIQVLIQHIFPNLELHGWDAPYMVQRAILTPTNDDVQKLNDMIIDQFPGEEHNLLSFDEVEGDNHNLYQQEFLNSIAQGSLPSHILKIKKGAQLMWLRNLDPRY
ncbi:hypothetical protein KIW84_076621 [Lathyrus oleraceus]|uniref:ATP-dependent DNA helicase n=1 Tax=Pisum sativum TaxID=3888 RepID=A0A9D4VX12_PEA|nr:hypothetical protein KIW84_076621 [Pisum sativum]